MIHCAGVGAQAVQVKNSIHFSSSLLRITLHKFQQIWWKFTMNPSKVKRQSYNMNLKCSIFHPVAQTSSRATFRISLFLVDIPDALDKQASNVSPRNLWMTNEQS